MKKLIARLQESLAQSDRKGTFPVPECHGRRFVIPDIHGCSNTFRELVEKIALTEDDQLFLIGDYIDKGLDSKGVLDFISELDENNMMLYPIRGNHEQMFLDISKKNAYMIESYAKRERLTNLLDGQKIKEPYRSFFECLPYYYELKDFYIVHAGFNFKAANPFEDFEEMLWIRDYTADPDWVGSKSILHGHTPSYKSVIMECIQNHYSVIPLDNGCVFSNGGFNENYGNLICLNLDTYEVIVQPNINDIVR
ncbi:MAG: metallophosphoesterase [Flammeovirgaceae bacterium]